MKKARASFWELAQSRVVYRTEAEQIDFEKKIFGKDWQRSTAIYVMQTDFSRPEDDPEKFIGKSMPEQIVFGKEDIRSGPSSMHLNLDNRYLIELQGQGADIAPGKDKSGSVALHVARITRNTLEADIPQQPTEGEMRRVLNQTKKRLESKFAHVQVNGITPETSFDSL